MASTFVTRPRGLHAVAGLLMAALLLAASSAGLARAQETYPDRAVTLVVPFPPGGTLDTAARLVADEMQKSLGQSVIVDNRSGAGGNIGADIVAKAAPDGYTILMGALSTHGVNVSLYRDMPFDPIEDFAPISLVGATPNILVVGEALDVDSFEAFLEAARAAPDGLTYASGSIGSAGHLAGELLAEATGLNLTHVPYRGSAAAVQAVLSGEVDFIFDNLASASSHIAAGTVRPLAVTTAERSPFAADVPTMTEVGVEGFDITTWFGILAPADTPRPIVDRLNAEIRAALEAPRTVEVLAAQGTTITPTSPEEFADYIASEIDAYAAIIERAGIEAE